MPAAFYKTERQPLLLHLSEKLKNVSKKQDSAFTSHTAVHSNPVKKREKNITNKRV